MKQDEFITELKKRLKSLPKEEVDDIVQDYQDHFKEAKKKKRKEETVVSALGDPKILAKQLVASYHVEAAKNNASVQNVGRALIAIISLSFFNLIFVLGPVLGIFGVLLGLYAAGIALILSGLVAVAAGIVVIVWGDILFGLGAIFGGIALGALALLWLVGSAYVTKFFFKALAAYMGLNVRIVKGEKK